MNFTQPERSIRDVDFYQDRIDKIYMIFGAKNFVFHRKIEASHAA